MISIIVPIYNAEKYLKSAILSVIAQTYGDWELILVDDGSSDNSLVICRKYAEVDCRIKVFHQENGGVSRARNFGIDASDGEFIVFLDSDDELPPNSLERMIYFSEKNDADIVCGEYINFLAEGDKIRNRYRKSGKALQYNSIDAIKDTLYQRHLNNSPWGKLYKRGLWDEVRFTPDIRYEDLDNFYLLFLKAKRILYTNEIVYYYRKNEDSYINTFSQSRFDVLRVTQKIVDFCKKNYPQLLKASISRQVSANFNIISLISTSEYCDIKEECWLKLKEIRKITLFDFSAPIKNKIFILLSYVLPKNVISILLKKSYWFLIKVQAYYKRYESIKYQSGLKE